MSDELLELARSVHARLVDLGQTVGCAESLTGGELSAALSVTPGASSSFRGGLVVYATDLKSSLAGVPSDLLETRGAVDPDVAAGLARGALERLGVTWGIGITGVAGPDPQDSVPVGTVYVSVCGPSGQVVAAHHFEGDRNTIRSASVVAALRLLASAIGAG